MPRPPRGWNDEDRELHRIAVALLRKRYRKGRHTVAAALRTSGGKVYTGVCVDGLHSPCAEPIALGAAIVAGAPTFRTIVAVNRAGVLPPCGNCRQMLIDYAPALEVLVQGGSHPRKVRASELLPFPYRTFS